VTPSRDRLSRSQELYLAAMENNQSALVDRITAMLAPIQLHVEELTVMIAAIQQQIDQLHLRQEAQERVNEWIVGSQEEKRIILHDINARLTEREQGSSIAEERA
jgi:hypothetical protein